jgi:hypothetical protein
MSARVASSMSGSAMTSEMAKRPPGRSTRAASARTRSLSPARFTTQLEMTTSTQASARGCLDVALDELDVLEACLRGVCAGQVEHLVGHVQADCPPGRAHAARGDEHVRARTGAKIEHRLAFVQVGDRGRDPAAQEAPSAAPAPAASSPSYRASPKTWVPEASVSGTSLGPQHDEGAGALAAAARAAAAYLLRTCSRMLSWSVSPAMRPAP